MRILYLLGVLPICALAIAAAAPAMTPSVRMSGQITLDQGFGEFRIAQAPVDSRSAGATATQAPSSGPRPAKCEEAEVNPVTGHAECVRPRGAAVDPPPRSAVPCSAHYAAGTKRAARNRRQKGLEPRSLSAPESTAPCVAMQSVRTFGPTLAARRCARPAFQPATAGGFAGPRNSLATELTVLLVR